jgi:glycerophosphoryl diester phosphodiesterase
MNLTVAACCLLCSLVAVAGTSRAAEAGRGTVPFVAHRGESHDAPENTMAAFDLAWSRGDSAVELDVHLTKDGKLICSHDANTKRTAGVDMAIKAHDAAELMKLDVGTWKNPRFANERMPLLDDVLAKLPDDPARRLLIEVKVGPEAGPELARCLERAKRPARQTVVISFDIDVIRDVKQRLPHLKAYWLAAQKQDKETKVWAPTGPELIAKAKSAGADGLDVSAATPLVDAAFVKAAKHAGLELHVWTVDDPARAKELIGFGVDSVTTNRAARMREQVTAGGPAKAK